MSAQVARVGDALRLGLPIVLLGLIALAAVAAVATRLGGLPLILGLALLCLVALTGFRWPLLPLVLFAALIPIEEVVVFEGFGTVSRMVGLLFAVTYGAPRLGRLRFGVIPAVAWAYLAWAVVSLGWAIDPATAWEHLLTLLQLFLIATLVADFVVRRPSIVLPVLWAYSLSAAVTALAGIWLYIGQGLATDTRAAAIENQDPAQFAAVLLPGLVFGIYQLAQGKRKILAGTVAFLTTIGVIVSGTRGAWVAAVVAVLLFVLPQLTPRRRVATIAAVLVLLVGASQVPGVADLVAERSGNALSTGGAGRTDIWSVGLTIFRSSPLTGVGYANFPVAYTSDAVRATAASYPSAFIEGRGPHNLVVGTLAELGSIGLLLLALFVLPLLLRRGWGPDATTVRAVLASMCVLALFLDIFGNRKQVWLVIGLAAGLAYLRQRSDRTVPDGPAAPDTAGTELATRPDGPAMSQVPHQYRHGGCD